MNIFLRAGAALLVTSAIASPAGAAPSAERAVPGSADARLKALYDGYARWESKEQGSFENSRGELESTAYLPRVDEPSQRRRAAYLKGLLSQLNAVPAAQLSPDERVNAEIFRTVLENAISDARFRTWEMPFNSDSSFWTYLDASRSFDDAAGYRRYIARMREIPRYFDEQTVNIDPNTGRGLWGRREIVLTLDIDPEKLPGQNRSWRQVKHELSYYHFPSPALVLTPDAKAVRWYR